MVIEPSGAGEGELQAHAAVQAEEAEQQPQSTGEELLEEAQPAVKPIVRPDNWSNT